VHILSLRQAVSFGTFLDISDTDLCHSTAPNTSLSSLSVYSSIVEQFDTNKYSAQAEGNNPKFRIMSLSYNKAIVFIRRLFNKRRQDQSS
jgi:hypothetical protein